MCLKSMQSDAEVCKSTKIIIDNNTLLLKVCSITHLITTKFMKSNWDTSVLRKYFVSTVCNIYKACDNMFDNNLVLMQGQAVTGTNVCIIPVHVPGHWKLGVIIIISFIFQSNSCLHAYCAYIIANNYYTRLLFGRQCSASFLIHFVVVIHFLVHPNYSSMIM